LTSYNKLRIIEDETNIYEKIVLKLIYKTKKEEKLLGFILYKYVDILKSLLDNNNMLIIKKITKNRKGYFLDIKIKGKKKLSECCEIRLAKSYLVEDNVVDNDYLNMFE
jgi:hypothetical protein